MRRTAIDKVLSNLDAKIERLDYAMGLVMAGATGDTLASDIARLKEVKALIVDAQPPAEELKPRKPRTKKAPKAAKE